MNIKPNWGKRFLLLLLHSVVCFATVNAQTITVKAKVTDTDGEPVSYCTIELKGTARKVIAGSNGFFTFPRLTAGDTLAVSSVGYATTQRIITPTTALLTITLQPLSKQLQKVEVVSTGYQSIPKERATGSFVKVNTDLFNQKVAPDIISKMEGITSGLVFVKGVPGRPAELNIRGQSTLFSNSQPLLVVDNFPYEGDINTINPNEVESITVLKDAAAASIWGVRAGNGVIVITTKKGKYNRALQLAFNSNITLGNAPDLFYDRSFIASPDFIALETFLFNQGAYNDDFNAPDQRPLSPVVDLLHRQQLGVITPQQAQEEITQLKQHDVRNDLQKYFYRSAVNQQYSLSLQGGSDEVNYFLSAGYDNDFGNLVGSSNERVSIHSSTVFRPVKKLEISASIDYIPTVTKGDDIASQIELGGPNGRRLLPYTLLADEKGNALPITKDYNTAFVAVAPANGFLNWQFNPLSELRNKDNSVKSKSYETRIVSSIKYDFIKGLSGSLLFQYEKAITNNEGLYTADSYYARNLVNMFSAVSPTGQFVNYVIQPGGILDQSQTELTANSARGQLNYSYNRNKHAIDAIAGAEVREIVTSGSTNRLYGYNDDLATFAPVDPTNYYTIYPAGYGFPISNGESVSGTTDRFRSYFANAAYSYNSRYTISASARIDGSNYFGVAANQKNVPLWSAGFKWDIDKEAFYHIAWLPLLKTRVTYGYNGNLNKQVTAFTTGRYEGADPYTNQPFLTITSPPNKNLQWEKTAMLNIAVDFGIVKDIISGSLEYYSKKGADIIGENELPASTGFIDINDFTNTVKGNYANIKGHGFDLVLASKNINRAFKWNTQLLLSYTTDKVTRYGGTIVPASLVYFGSGAGSMVVPLKGKPVYGIYSIPWAGLDPATGDPQGFINGKTSKDYDQLANPSRLADIKYDGPARPEYYGSLVNTFSYKNLSVFVTLTYKFHYYFRRTSVNYYNLFNYYSADRDYAKRWQQPGDEKTTQVPSLVYPADYSRESFYNSSSVLTEKGDHIRVQDVSLSYDIDKNVWKQLPVNRIKLYAYINNVGLLWKANKQGIDPDYLSGFPAPTTWALGLHVEF